MCRIGRRGEAPSGQAAVKMRFGLELKKMDFWFGFCWARDVVWKEGCSWGGLT